MQRASVPLFVNGFQRESEPSWQTKGVGRAENCLRKSSGVAAFVISSASSYSPILSLPADRLGWQADLEILMRDFVVVVIVFGSIPFILVRPQVGILMWYWISLMNPHRWTWGYAYALRVALVVGLATIVAWLISRERKTPPNTAIVYFLAGLSIWISVSTYFAIVPDIAFEKWQEAIKILGMTFIAICIINSKDRVLQAVWVITLSIGAYGIKGGLFGVATGGSYHVYGPDESFIADNNQLGLALIMILPLFHFISNQPIWHFASYPKLWRWLRLGMVGSMGLTIVAILCTYSRGALVALAITLFAFWLKAKRRLVTGTIALLVLGGALAYLPTTWYDRMSTIDNYEADESAQGRINSWVFAVRLAADHPLTGGGFRVVDNDALYFHYVPSADVVHNFHSIYFEMLGEHGYVGLCFFLGLIAATLVTAQSIIRTARGRPDLEWAGQLAAAIQISIIGYCSAGAFVNLGFYDLFYALVAVIASTKVVVAQATAAAPRVADQPLSRPAPQGAFAPRV
jgi:putative inorganic carbon (HCO3(-)) transporter